jgi:hypothetical protein
MKCGNDRVELNQAQVRKTRLWGGRAKGKIVFMKKISTAGAGVSFGLPSDEGQREPGQDMTDSSGLTLKVESYRNKTIKKNDKAKR